MKRSIALTLLLCAAAVILPALKASAQQKTVIETTDGEKHAGYVCSPIHASVQYVDMSAEPLGATVRYPVSRIEQITFTDDDGQQTKFVRENYYRLVTGTKRKPSSRKLLFREDYVGRGITLYSELKESQDTRGLVTRTQKERWYYIKLDGDQGLRKIGGEILDGNRHDNKATFRAFSKRAFEDYPEMVERIKSNDFGVDDPMALVKAFEQLCAK